MLGLLFWMFNDAMGGGCVDMLKSKKATPPPSLPAKIAGPNDADQTVAVLAALYLPVCRGNSARVNWDECTKERKSYDQLKACAAASLEDGRAATTAVNSLAKTIGTTPCSQDLELRLRQSAEANGQFLADVAAWLDRNKASITRVAAKGPIRDLRDEIPDEFPSFDGTKYPGRGAHVNIECTKTLFQCGYANNVCWVNKVADRLGLNCKESTPKTSDDPDHVLRERATGRVIPPRRK
jgi:hypothetical protein